MTATEAEIEAETEVPPEGGTAGEPLAEEGTALATAAFRIRVREAMPWAVRVAARRGRAVRAVPRAWEAEDGRVEEEGEDGGGNG